MWPSVVGQARFLGGSARVHASTGRHAGEDLAFERQLAGAERSPLPPPQTSRGLQSLSRLNFKLRALRRIQPLELRLAVQEREIRIAPRPDRVLEPRVPRLLQRLERLGLPASMQYVQAAL